MPGGLHYLVGILARACTTCNAAIRRDRQDSRYSMKDDQLDLSWQAPAMRAVSISREGNPSMLKGNRTQWRIVAGQEIKGPIARSPCDSVFLARVAGLTCKRPVMSAN